MFFTVANNFTEVPTEAYDAAFLVVDNWDDWFSYRTMFTLWVFDEQGTRHRVGSVKIGQDGLRPSGAVGPGARSPELDNTFDSLDDRFFSLGQDENYYETLNSLSISQRDLVLLGLRDCAFDLDIFNSARNQQVMQRSLLVALTHVIFVAA
ncbi:hypothetical protein LB553_18780 [Mesorhizobium sp. CA8]|uniref:hypothetical protein n=1 Tax=Mesorhizobium sp. CA8 TaxID=2876637 RepID=UPI001CCE4583|nr:hypothetical protein [Mesorhizobium sp. CA8]MBZ9762906.1 hypothetical protein [Mesorhizobium sp. CA8]